MPISRSYKASPTKDGNFYLYLTVKKSPKDRKDQYLGKFSESDIRIKLIIERKQSTAKLQKLAEADSKKLGME